MTEEPAARIPARVRLGAVIAVALAIAFVAWLLVRGSDSANKAQSSTAPATTVSATSNAVAAKLIAPAELQALQTTVGHPIYWAGAPQGRATEVTITKEGWVYVRYLPSGARAGDSRELLTVVTYPVPDAYSRLQALAKDAGEHVLAVPGGGIGLYSRVRPTNVYVAYPGIASQIEVFDPSPQAAQTLVTAGKISPVG
jgi:hypothetical protein